MRPPYCRACGYHSQVESLIGRRLYALDRRILVGAATAGTSEGHFALPQSAANSDRVMLRRSVAKLQRYGLLDYRNAWLKGPRVHEAQLELLQLRDIGWPRLVRRTPFGDEIVRLYERELRVPGARIRWDGRVYDAVIAARHACGHAISP